MHAFPVADALNGFVQVCSTVQFTLYNLWKRIKAVKSDLHEHRHDCNLTPMVYFQRSSRIFDSFRPTVRLTRILLILTEMFWNDSELLSPCGSCVSALIVSIVIRAIGGGTNETNLHLPVFFVLCCSVQMFHSFVWAGFLCRAGRDDAVCFFLSPPFFPSIERSCASSFTVCFIVSWLCWHPWCRQCWRSPHRGAKAAGGQMAGDAEQLGQMDGQKAQEGLSEEL